MPFTSMLSSSPMKGFSYYFPQDPETDFLSPGNTGLSHLVIGGHNAPGSVAGEFSENYEELALQQPVKISVDAISEQENLFPAMHAFHNNIPQSQSLQSMDSVPFLSASTSEQSLGSGSFYQTPSKVRRLSATLTPMTQIYESPEQRKNPSPVSSTKNTLRTPRMRLHKRTKSRLSLDASGCAAIVTERKSPGTNPFYNAFASPNQYTPLQTPLRDQLVSPSVTMTSSSSLQNIQQHAHFPHFVQPPQPLRSVSMQSLTQQQQQQQQHHLPHQPLRSVSMNAISTGQHMSLGMPFPESQAVQHHMTRSQSSVNLATIAASATPPPEITKFDILEPRRNKASKIPCDKKQHVCPLCGGVFQRPEHVKRHMRSHSSEKPFECDECGKKFNRPDNLRAHGRKIHGKHH